VVSDATARSVTVVRVSPDSALHVAVGNDEGKPAVDLDDVADIDALDRDPRFASALEQREDALLGALCPVARCDTEHRRPET
jgi:hypothetical protein